MTVNDKGTDNDVGISASALLAAIIPLFELDTYGETPVMMMEGTYPASSHWTPP